MPLSCGIVGLPNVGKSTIFNALTRSAAQASNYPFATIEPNVAEIPVPDERLAVLAQLVQSRRIVPAAVRFVDIAGLSRGASSGQGLGNAFLGHIREADALAMVVRCFENPDVSHVEGKTDPLRDIEIVGIEMSLADLATMRKKIERMQKEARGNPKILEDVGAAENLIAALEDGKPARSFPLDAAERRLALESFLLTVKPLLYVANIDETQLLAPGPLVETIRSKASEEGSNVVAISGRLESELAAMSEEEAASFGQELGVEKNALNQLIVSAYELLGLMTFLTAGPKEVRAWTIELGTKAPQAAGKIHSDLERGFIRAEVVNYEDYAKYKTMEALRAAGKVRSEGRNYVIQEGDVIDFKFNV